MQILPSVILSRQSTFSAALKLEHPHWSPSDNQSVFGKYMRPHGAEFKLRIDLRGPISQDDGMIVNLRDVKPQIEAVVSLLEDKFLNIEVAYFGLHRPTTENVSRFLWDNLPTEVGNGNLCKLTLTQSGATIAEIERFSSATIMKVSRSYEFAAAHRLYSSKFSDEENFERFGKCSNLLGHGHNFQLTVWVKGEPDPDTGFIISPSVLDGIVNEEIYDRFDHRHLNEDCSEFSETGLVPTSENLALVIFDLLKKRLSDQGYQLARVGLRETQKNYFEVEA